VARDPVGDARHYGSMYTMADYKSKVHNIYFNANYAATEKMRLFGTVTYNMAEAALDEVLMPDVSDRLVNPNVAGGVDLTHANFDFEEMPTYSDFDYKMLSFQLGLSYKITPTLTFTADGKYADLTDDAGYVYGTETGSFYVVRSGFKVDF
jgi:hypothetical protein